MNPYSVTPLPSDIMGQLSENCRRLRKLKKYSQQEIADRAGVSLGSLKRFENTGQISLESLLKLAHVLGRLDDFKPVFYVDENVEAVKLLFDQK